MSEAKKPSDECIQVVVRCRPLNKKENDEKRKSIIAIDGEAHSVSIRNPDAPDDAPKMFTYDASYDENTQQRFFYDESCFGIIESTLEGFNSTIFAYGQTGCGKSFTMQGPSTTVEELKGVIPNSFSHIFQCVKSSKDVEFLIRCTYLELYNEEIKDLLCPRANVKCELKEDVNTGIFVKNLSAIVVENENDLAAMFDKGLENRTTAATLMNSESSRSHSIFTIVIEMSTKEADGKETLRVGKLNLVDLAGSERQKKTGATDATLKEGIKINLSLSVLGNVISALSQGSKHIPYRESKLTRLLQDSLGGNTKTMMVAAISPADYNYDETLSTLRYANRAKNIKNKPKINEDAKDAMIREYKDEIERLKKLLMEKDSTLMQQLMNGGGGGGGGMTASATSLVAEMLKPLQSLSPRAEMNASTVSVQDVLQNKQPQIAGVAFPLDGFAPGTADSSAGYATDDPDSAIVVTAPVIPQRQHSVLQTINGSDVSPSKDFHDKLREKDSEIEKERNMREELAKRLAQLEHLFVNKQDNASPAKPSGKPPLSPRPADTGNNQQSSLRAPPINSMQLAPQTVADEKEEEALRKYRERKLKAKKKQQQQQQQEMQRILDEKRQMEDELEELRQSAQQMQLNNAVTSASAPNSSHQAGNNSETERADSEQWMKKLSRVKKRYEKKLAAAKEELEELRDDFYFQRKQLVDGLIEQEKDMKLYELICKSLLSEKDFKKIVDKCRYDEDNDEWVLPVIKRKNIDVDGMLNSGGGKLLPDIHGKNGSLSARGEYGSSNNSNGMQQVNGKGSLVPLLTLPGGMMPPAVNTMMSPNDYVQQPLPSQQTHLVSINKIRNEYDAAVSSRSEAGEGIADESSPRGIGYDDGKKKKGSKSSASSGNIGSSNNNSKIPKLPNKVSVSDDYANVVRSNHQQQQQQQTQSSSGQVTKMPPVNGVNSGRNSSRAGMRNGEIGSGETAGSVMDWGFEVLNKGMSNGGPEQEYSDEEFETEETGNEGGGGPHPPKGEKPANGRDKAHRRKKKRRKDKENEGNDIFNTTTTLDNKQITTPRMGSLLPPI